MKRGKEQETFLARPGDAVCRFHHVLLGVREPTCKGGWAAWPRWAPRRKKEQMEETSAPYLWQPSVIDCLALKQTKVEGKGGILTNSWRLPGKYTG